MNVYQLMVAYLDHIFLLKSPKKSTAKIKLIKITITIPEAPVRK